MNKEIIQNLKFKITKFYEQTGQLTIIFWLLARYGHLGKVINIIHDYYRNRFRNLLRPQQQQQLHSQITYHGQLLSSPSAPLFLTNSVPVPTDFNKRYSINLSAKPEPCQKQNERNSVQFEQAQLK